MKCPGCSAEVAEGTSICPSCDYIIDDSFLGEGPAPELEARGEGDTNPGLQSPAPPSARPGKKKKPAARKGKASNGAAELRGPAPLPLRPVPTAPTLPPQYTPDAQGVRAPSYSPVFSPEEAMDDARLFVGGLNTGDKLALFGGALTLLFSFFPWKETAAEGDVIGLQTLGVVAAGLAALEMMAVVGRVRRSVNRAAAWLVQLGCAGATIVWCLVFMKLSWDPTQAQSLDGNVLVAVSKPALGVFLTVVSGIISVAGTMAGLKDTDR